jgi:hypothetical protein
MDMKQLDQTKLNRAHANKFKYEQYSMPEKRQTAIKKLPEYKIPDRIKVTMKAKVNSSIADMYKKTL